MRTIKSDVTFANYWLDTVNGLKAIGSDKVMVWELIVKVCKQRGLIVPTIEQIEFIS